jgi:hypothetical protein
MSNRAPGLFPHLALRILSHSLGSGRLWPAVVAVLLVTSLSWLGNSLYELLQWLDGQPLSGWIHLAFGLAGFPVLLVVLTGQARQVRQQLHPTVYEDDQPRRVRGLVLYLSVMRPEDCQVLRDACRDGLDLAAFRERFPRVNWRMPVEAIAYHAERLEELVVIPSAGETGSAAQMDLFRALLDRLFPAARFECRAIDLIPGNHPAGLDFETHTEHLARATNDAYEFLRGKGFKPLDILIDVTGGLKPTTVVGCAVALAEGRRMQYVSTQDYRIRVYDVSYEP